jgi:hypothetical protein
MYQVPTDGLPDHVRAADEDPQAVVLPHRTPGVVLARARAAEDAEIRAGAEWPGWFADRGQVRP